MAENPDLPPAYSSLQLPPATVNIDIVEDAESKCDDRTELLVNNLFEDKTTRLIFIQKVLTIKLLQLLGVAVVVGFAAAFQYSYRWFMDYNTIHVIVLSLFAYIVIFILTLYCDDICCQKPFIFLVVWPLSIACFISSVTYWTALTEVAIAWGYHCVAVFALLVYNIFVMRTRFDFNNIHGMYICTGVQIVMYALTVPFVYVDPFYVLYPTIVLFLEHLYLLFALEMMTFKTYKSALTPDDYIDAAINLHIDYMYIFIKLLLPEIRHVLRECMETCVMLYPPRVASLPSPHDRLSPS